jgi:hypothetical protein
VSALGVRCRHCGRAGLPPVPYQKLGSGEASTEPVAHVKQPADHANGLAFSPEPCLAGLNREVLGTCVEPGILAPTVNALKETIWTTEALWCL